MEQNQRLTAAQRLEGLEAACKALDTALYNLVKDLADMKQKQNDANDQLNALVSLMEKGQAVSQDSVKEENLKTRLAAMSEGVRSRVEAGILVASDTVTPSSFMVGVEKNPQTGEVTQQRVQFAMFAVTEESLYEKILGQKVGSVIQTSDTNSLEITEIYEIQTDANETEMNEEEISSEPTQEEVATAPASEAQA